MSINSQVDAITHLDNPWIAFERLEELGSTTYRETIRESLRPAVVATIPSYYSRMWSLRLAGVMTLNLDRLAARSFSETHPGKHLTEFTGSNISPHLHVLRDPSPFVVNLHGDIGDVESWVFTRRELDALRASEGYQTFIRTCLAGYTVLFVGISADDLAVGGHLTAIRDLGMDVGTHYWLTNRSDAITDTWAESAGVRIVRYSSIGNDHSNIDGFFDDLDRFVSVEEPAAPPIAFEGHANPSPTIAAPQDLVTKDAETIRLALNSHASALLADPSPEAYQQYSTFLQDYDEAVHRAWYTSITPGRNLLLGYQLEEEIARGAFGKVYRATAPDGSVVAVKVLLGEIRTQEGFLQSFRRGVRSMEILSRHGVQGMVAYRQASEIPALVVMDLIEGPNLKAAVEAHQIEDWHTLLRIATALTDVLRRAHALPERVLHRDLRPANVMLKGFWTQPDEWEVVVLDFDLSWHRGAYEQSVLQNTGIAGYLAPEQIEQIRGTSTRHAAVDAFGVGMTLYFMTSRVDPVPNQHRHTSWLDNIRSGVSRIDRSPWHSLPYRFARLVAASTQDEQSRRWDMSQVNNELTRLHEAHLEPLGVRAADMLAEEVMARCQEVDRYEWDEDGEYARLRLLSGVDIQVQAMESEGQLELHISWMDRGSHDWKSIRRWIGDASASARSYLERSGWDRLDVNVGSATFDLRASITTEKAAQNLDGLAGGLGRAISELRFQ